MARAINEMTLGNLPGSNLKEELAQVAAVALRWLAVEVGGDAERDALAAKLEEVTREREMLRDNASREWERINARLKQAERERNEYHQMLRDILEICGATTRQTIGPDAPLRTVRALVARAEQAERELRTLCAAMPTAEEREALVELADEVRSLFREQPQAELALAALDKLTKGGA